MIVLLGIVITAIVTLILIITIGDMFYGNK
jgi:hypothetical protein